MKDKIIIHYIWFKEYYCYKDFECNFSSKYKFSYNHDDKSVSFEDHSKDYVDDFFDDNIDVSVIVGNNGAGKTTLLRFILNFRKNSFIDTTCVIVLEKKNGNNSKFWAGKFNQSDNGTMANHPVELEINGFPPVNYKFREYQRSQLPCCGDIRFIYLTELFSMNHYFNGTDFINDLSVGAQLYEQTINGDEEKHNKNPILKYDHRLIDWQISFLSGSAQYIRSFNINYPEFLVIQFNYDSEAFTEFYVQVHKDRLRRELKDDFKGNDKELNDIIANKTYELETNSRSYFQSKVEKNVNEIDRAKNECALALLSTIISSRKYFAEKNSRFEPLLDIIDEADSDEEMSLWGKVEIILEKIKTYNKNENQSLLIDPNRYISFMSFFESYIEKKEKYYNSYRKSFFIPTGKMEDIKEFFDNYKKCVSIVEFCSFSWGLSSGEKRLLNMFAKLAHILKPLGNGKMYLPKNVNEDEPASNAVIMFDEAEVGYHPEWQRRYFHSIIRFIKDNIAVDTTNAECCIGIERR